MIFYGLATILSLLANVAAYRNLLARYRLLELRIAIVHNTIAVQRDDAATASQIA
jgi:hypothetical protein